MKTALCLVIMLLPACSSGPFRTAASEPVEPDFVIVHTRIYADVPGADAVSVRGSKIVAVGATGDLRSTCRGHCELIDAQGKFLMPGFHDTHIHLIDAAKAQLDLQTNGTTLLQVQSSLRAYAFAHPEKTWIYGGNWYVPAFQSHLPTRRDLDLIEPKRPVAVRDASGHQLWVNSRALELAGINRNTPEPSGGHIVRDANGDPTGVLLESATYAVRAAMPPPTAAEYEQYILAGQETTLALGLTSLTGAEVPMTLAEAQAYVRLDQRGLLRQRMFLWGNLGAKEEDFRAQVGLARSLSPDGKVSIAAFKGFVDGVLTASTAAMIDPYVGTTSRGLAKLSQAQLNMLVLRANRAGFPAALHAMGDRAVKMALDAFEYSAAVLDRRFPNRVEHATVVASEDLPRFKKLGVVASVQPNFVYYSSPQTFPLPKAFGAERMRRTYAWKSLADSGALLTFGSDHPDGGASNADPVTGLYCAIQRKFRDGTPYSPEQRLDSETALRAYTTNPALALGLGDRLGKIAVGYEADLVGLAHDPRMGTAKSVAENPIFLVMIAGVRIR